MVVCVILAVLTGILALVALGVGIYNYVEGNARISVGCWCTCIVMALLFIFLPWNFKTVDNGEVAVVKNLGKVEEVREPGMYTDLWLTKSYVKLDTKRRQVDIVTAAYSNYKQTMDLTIVVQYQIKKDMAKEIVIHYGTLDMLEARIQSVAIERTKAIMSSYTADSLIEQRSIISAAVADAVEEALGEAYYIDITNVALTNIDFSDAYEAAVEQKMIATQEVERAKAEAQKAEETAKGQLKVAEQEAKAQIAKAEAEAKAKELAAQAEANAIAIKSLEVARMLGLTIIDDNGTVEDTADDVEIIKPNLTADESKLIAEYLKYIEYLSNWDGKLPEVVTNGTVLLPTP